MVSLSKILLYASIASALIVERDVTKVLNNLKAVDTALKQFTSSCQTWTGTASGAMMIDKSESQLDDAVNAATEEAKTEPQMNSADSKVIIGYGNSPITPDLKILVNSIVAKKTQFAAVGLTSVILSSFKQLKPDFDALGAALKALASSDQKAPAQNMINTWDSIWSSGIAVFS